MAFNISSRAFEYGAGIPVIYTCDGDNVSPPLRWDEVPKGTVSLALILEDPDAPGGVFTHWIVYNLPPESTGLDTIVPVQVNLDNGASQGKNDFGKIGYGGPCPPKGEEHRYYFRLYALKKKLPVHSADKRDDFHSAIKDQVIETAEYMGTFKH